VEVGIQAKLLPDIFLAHSSTFAARISRVVGDRCTWRLKWERLKAGESNGKLPPRTCPGCSVPEPYRLHDWALVPAKPGLQGWILMNEWCQTCLKVEGGQFQHVLMCGKVFNMIVNVDSMDGLFFISDTMLICTCFLNYSIFAKDNTSRRITEELEYRKHFWTVIFLFLSFRRVLNVICSFLGNSPASEF